MRRRSPQTRIPSRFTPRQREILRAHEQGESYAHIASRMGLSRARVHQIAVDASRRRDMVCSAKAIAALSRDHRDTPIEILPLSTRSINALRKYGVRTLRDLEQCTADEILAIKNLGVASLREIEKLIRRKRED